MEEPQWKPCGGTSAPLGERLQGVVVRVVRVVVCDGRGGVGGIISSSMTKRWENSGGRRHQPLLPPDSLLAELGEAFGPQGCQSPADKVKRSLRGESSEGPGGGVGTIVLMSRPIEAAAATAVSRVVR